MEQRLEITGDDNQDIRNVGDNNTFNIPVSHPGYYRVMGGIKGYQGGVEWAGYIRGGAYCYMR